MWASLLYKLLYSHFNLQTSQIFDRFCTPTDCYTGYYSTSWNCTKLDFLFTALQPATVTLQFSNSSIFKDIKTQTLAQTLSASTPFVITDYGTLYTILQAQGNFLCVFCFFCMLFIGSLPCIITSFQSLFIIFSVAYSSLKYLLFLLIAINSSY